MALDETRELRTLTGAEAREALAMVTGLPGVPAGLTVRGLLRRVKIGRDRLKAQAEVAKVAQASNAIGAINEAARAAADAQVAAKVAEMEAARVALRDLDAVDYGTD